MARLPTPGGDSGNWGTILNDFLSVEHEADGTLKSDGSLASKADASHTHAQSDVTGLETALDDRVTEAEVDALVEQALEDHTPGIELGYAERTTSYSAGNSDISGLSVIVTGQGRPVDIEFYCPTAYHSVTGTLIRADIKSNGTIVNSWFDVTSNTAAGRTCQVKQRLVLTDGVEYTFTIGTFQGTGGTMTWFASASPVRPMWLSVVSR
jgi:hypothetical protein